MKRPHSNPLGEGVTAKVNAFPEPKVVDESDQMDMDLTVDEQSRLRRERSRVPGDHANGYDFSVKRNEFCRGYTLRAPSRRSEAVDQDFRDNSNPRKRSASRLNANGHHGHNARIDGNLPPPFAQLQKFTRWLPPHLRLSDEKEKVLEQLYMRCNYADQNEMSNECQANTGLTHNECWKWFNERREFDRFYGIHPIGDKRSEMVVYMEKALHCFGNGPMFESINWVNRFPGFDDAEVVEAKRALLQKYNNIIAPQILPGLDEEIDRINKLIHTTVSLDSIDELQVTPANFNMTDEAWLILLKALMFYHNKVPEQMFLPLAYWAKLSIDKTTHAIHYLTEIFAPHFPQ